jgi:LPS-assembly protein
VPGKRRILPLAISGLLLVPTAQAAPKWDCRATSNGDWECFQDGVPVAPETTRLEPRPAPVEPVAPVPSQPESVTTQEEAVTQAVEEPKAPEGVPLVAPQITEESATQASSITVTEEHTETPPTEVTEEQAPAQTEAHKAETEQTPPETDTTTTPPETAIAEKPVEQIEPATARQEAPKAPEPEQPAGVVTTDPEPQPALPIASSTIHRIDRGLDWNQCGIKTPRTVQQTTLSQDDTTHIEADAADLYRTENRAVFTGNVKLDRGNDKLEADNISYLKESNILDAEGNVYLEQPGLRVTSNKLHYDLENQQGNADQAEFRLTDPVARGTATTAEIINANQSRYTQVNYTTCQPGNSDWLIEAEEMEIDQATGVGVARNTKLRFKGVPFIYLPYASFPIDDRRKSGFLPPSIGTSENTGADISIPYYFNIAPQMDATFTPRIMSKRGLLLGGEFRYLAEKSQGTIKAELLPSDSEQGPGENDTRGALNVELNGTPATAWRYDIDLNYVSDKDYIDDLGTSLAATSVKHQERRGDIQYQGAGWSFLGRAQQYQTIDRLTAINDRPYSRLPQVLVNLEKPDQSMGLTYHLQSEYVNFDHSSDTKVKGSRLDLQPGISLPMRRPWGFLTPKLSLRHTHYNLENQTTGLNDNPSRTLPTLSIDSGLYFERDANWFGNAITQTLEPRLYYLYTPKEDQSDIPDFDTATLDFSFANLFRENRFSGSDKVGDANQLTTALTSRSLSSETGEELFRASIGQISYFRDRDVQLQSGGAAVNDDSSSIVAEVATKLSSNWRMQAGLQWNPHSSSNATEKSAFGLHYLDEKQRILNLTYRHTNGSIEQTDLSARWPINHQFHAVGRWNYSLLHNKTMEAFAGIEYDSCCWVSRFIVRNYRSDANSEGNLALFLQIELKGLTSLGDKIDQFLERGILGYRTDN